MIAWVLAALAWGQCPEEGTTVQHLRTAVETAMAAYGAQDVRGYVEAFGAVDARLPCLDEPMGQVDAARILRFYALHATVLDDAELARAAFAAARTADPDATLSKVLADTNPALAELYAADVAADTTQPLPVLRGATLRVNGAPADAWSAARPSLLQVVLDDERVWWTALVTPPEELPAWLAAGELPTGTAHTPISPGFGYRMVRLRPGRFAMGSPDTEQGRDFGEDLHAVEITRPFLIGATEVTRELWVGVMGTDPGEFTASGRPIDRVSWLDAVAFCNRLSRDQGLEPAYTVDGYEVTWSRDANGYRLPTEAEWEYAARAGDTTRFSGSDKARDVAWFRSNGNARTHVPAQLAPNAWGLYDASGNVWEWVWDRYGDYPSDGVVDPAGADRGDYRVYRGGAYSSAMNDVRVAERGRAAIDYMHMSVGFRLARTP